MTAAVETRFGDRVLPLVDPHGLRLALVEPPERRARPFTPWDGSPVPGERQIRGLYGARLWERDRRRPPRSSPSRSASSGSATEGGWTRYGFADAAGVRRRSRNAGARGAARGASAACIIWRGAWTTTAHQLAVRDAGRGRRRAADAGHRSLLVQVGLLQGAGRRAVRARDRRAGVRGRRRSGASRRDAGAAAVARGASHGDRAVLPALKAPRRAGGARLMAASGLRSPLRAAGRRRPADAAAAARHWRQRTRSAAARPRAPARRRRFLSPRGKVLERGMPRFFRRLAEGVFDLEDLQFRARELAPFVAAAAAHYGFDRAA